jgi:hypothetical protein
MALAAAFATSLWLERIHIGSIALRIALCFLSGYAAYAVFLGIWLVFRPSLNSHDLLEGGPPGTETSSPSDDKHRNDAIEFVRQTNDNLCEKLGELGIQGLVLAIVLTAVFGTLLVGLFQIGYARWFLGELMVESGKVRRSGQSESEPLRVILTPIGRSKWLALALLFHFLTIGAFLENQFPGAASIDDVRRRL